MSLIAVLVASAVPRSARAGDDGEDESYESVVVQDRKFSPTHEFTGSVGVLPLDAFAKGVTVSGGYTLHFSNLLAWEALQFTYSFQVQTDLNDKLSTFGVEPTPFELLEYYLTSDIVFKPVYWKGSVLNTGLAYGEFYLVGGGTYGWYTRSSWPGFNVGAGIRLYGSQLVSFRLDTRYLFFLADVGTRQFELKDELWIGLGTSISF
ncbi:MAG: outer membrane beta-barrel domain-containing protein [Bradymonadaceae bacterium]